MSLLPTTLSIFSVTCHLAREIFDLTTTLFLLPHRALVITKVANFKSFFYLESLSDMNCASLTFSVSANSCNEWNFSLGAQSAKLTSLLHL